MATTSILKDGSVILEIPEKGPTCVYHKLHVKFLECGEPALYVLRPAGDEDQPLCERHMRIVVANIERDETPHDAPEWTPEDSLSLGLLSMTPTGDIEVTKTDPVVDNADEFHGGASGGAGGGATFDEDPVIPEAATLVEETEETAASVEETAAAPDESASDELSTSDSSSDSSPSESSE